VHVAPTGADADNGRSRVTDLVGANFSVLLTGAFAWLGFFLLSRARAPRQPPKPGQDIHERLLARVVGELAQPGRLLAGSAVLTAAVLFRESLVLHGTAPVSRGGAVVAVLAVADIWAPAAWALFTNAVLAGAGAPRPVAAGVLVLSFAMGLLRAAATQWPDLPVSQLSGITVAWMALLLAWSTQNLVQLRRSIAKSPEADGVRWLLAGHAAMVSATALFVMRSLAPDRPSITVVAETLLLIAALCVTYMLARYGIVRPFHQARTRRDFRISGAVVLGLSGAYAALIMLAVRALDLEYAIVLLAFVAATISHASLDTIWTIRSRSTIDGKEYVRELQKRIQQLELQVARGQEEERHAFDTLIHQRIIHPLSEVTTRVDSALQLITPIDGKLPPSAIDRAINELKLTTHTASILRDDSRSLVSAIYEPLLKEGALFAALTQLCQRRIYAASLYPLTAQVDPLRDYRFEPLVTELIYHLVMEGLNNASQKARGGGAEVTAELDSDITVTVKSWSVSGPLTAIRESLGNLTWKHRRGDDPLLHVGLPLMQQRFITAGGNTRVAQDGAGSFVLTGWLPTEPTAL